MRQFSVEGRRQDYCQLDTFTSTDINFILNLILYLGYGEFLNLGIDAADAPKTAPMSIALYQIQRNATIAVVGAFTTQLLVNSTALYWADGQVPTSGKNAKV